MIYCNFLNYQNMTSQTRQTISNVSQIKTSFHLGKRALARCIKVATLDQGT